MATLIAALVGGALLGAACVLAGAWGISVTAATRRDNWSPGA